MENNYDVWVGKENEAEVAIKYGQVARFNQDMCIHVACELWKHLKKKKIHIYMQVHKTPASKTQWNSHIISSFNTRNSNDDDMQMQFFLSLSFIFFLSFVYFYFWPTFFFFLWVVIKKVGINHLDSV